MQKALSGTESYGVIQLMTPDSEAFLDNYRKTLHSFLVDFSRGRLGEESDFDEGVYIALLSAVHGVTIDSRTIMDWTLLENKSLISAEERKLEEDALVGRLEDLGFINDENSQSGSAAIRPTFGMSIGMLYSLCEGMRMVGGVERVLTRSRQGGGAEIDMHFTPRREKIRTIQRRLNEWVEDNPLNEDERNDAIFAANAFTKFVTRRFSKNKTP